MIINNFPDRFSSKIAFGDGCWNWTASKNKQGYGQYRSGKMFSAHRFSWEFINGKIPDGMSVLHKCDVPSCVNPNHLFLGTTLDNMIDKRLKGRGAKGLTHGTKTMPDTVARGERHWSKKNPELIVCGEKSGLSKLSINDVVEIRKSYVYGSSGDFSLKGLAKKYGVTFAQIRNVVNLTSWKSVALEVAP